MILILRDGSESWAVYEVEELWLSSRGEAKLYEQVARVVKVRDLYHAETAVWEEHGVRWKRQSRGYLTPREAFRAITHPKVEPPKVGPS